MTTVPTALAPAGITSSPVDSDRCGERGIEAIATIVVFGADGLIERHRERGAGRDDNRRRGRGRWRGVRVCALGFEFELEVAGLEFEVEPVLSGEVLDAWLEV